MKSEYPDTVSIPTDIVPFFLQFVPARGGSIYSTESNLVTESFDTS